MTFKSLADFVTLLESENQLIRIKEYVNPHLEITEIIDRLSKHDGPAVLFENTGTEFPLLINSMGTEQRMCMALGVNHLDDIANDLEQMFKTITAPKNSFLDKLKLLPQLGQIGSWMPKQISGRGACQEVVMSNPDITKLPVMTCWPEDGGPFITLPVIQTLDPHTGIRNIGMYRMQVFEKTMTGMHWHRHKVSARHFNEYKKMGKRMPLSVILGGDPCYTYCATAPLPDGVDEFILAGFLRKRKVELVKCITNDLYVPSDADFVIEGYVDPEEEFILEGPFGDHTGYYSLADYYPRFHITCITHRKNAIYPSTIVGVPPQEDAWIGKATERIFIAPIKMTMLPEIVDMVLPVEGVFHNLVIVKIKKEYPGHALKVMNSLWGAGQMMFTKMMIVTDGDVNIHDIPSIARHIAANVAVANDLYFTQGPTDVLDHSCSRMSFGGKLGIDATIKWEEEMPLNSRNDKKVTRINTELIQKKFPEIKAINASLCNTGIPLLFITVEKNRKSHLHELSAQLINEALVGSATVILFLEGNCNISFVTDAVWRFTNNVDPKRDHWFGADGNIVFFDGTRKTKELDGFDRDWPNILISDDATIAKIDNLWNSLGLGKFLESPSLRYKSQVYEGGAIAR
ncbi:MAG: menaquinone biosynthesis decarboxylase [Bacteroidetes bacterium]|nr:menaquinone biosynthesis decarboxylase [Bacteroidota bacterium]